jgi:hypothetical protein
MKAFVAILVLSCALAGVQARELKQARSAAEALAGDSRLSTLNAAVKVNILPALSLRQRDSSCG